MAADSPNAIIIGAGPGGIALAYRLRHELGFDDFVVSIPMATAWCVAELTS
jgi:cation diffusion facilitator CzcD-associated flavoprotein CzcO